MNEKDWTLRMRSRSAGGVLTLLAIIMIVAQLIVQPATAATTQTPVLALVAPMSAVLHANPSSGAGVVARLSGGDVVWAEGRNANGTWLWVRTETNQRGWADRSVLKTYGSLDALPVVTATGAHAPTTTATPSQTGPTGTTGPTGSTRPAAVAPKPPAIDGKIAFMTATGGDIYLLDASGKLQRVVQGGMDPTFSRDGSKLAYTKWGVEPGVFVRDLATGEERRIAAAQKPRHPTWSPDGSKLAFVRLVDVVTCRESPLGCLTEDELRILFRGRACIATPVGELCIADMPIFKIDQTGIVEVGLDGQGWQDLPAPRDAQGVTWSPSGADLLFRGNQALQITGRDREPVSVVKDAGLSSPAWSPDGTRILAQARMHDHTEIALFDRSGRLVKYLTAPPSATRRAPHNVSPTWSPDGQAILFLSNRDGAWKLYQMNADGTGQALYRPDLLRDIAFQYDFVAERVVSWGR